MRNAMLLFLLLIGLSSCRNNKATKGAPPELDSTELSSSNEEGVRMIPITTSVGEFKVWTKKMGNHPTMKVLLLHGGPGATHEYFKIFDEYFPEANIEYYYYDQLESAHSDQPNNKALWTVDRYVDEVEQVRQALGLNKDNFYLLGSSWGGLLAMEYALKHQENLKGLIVSNMMASIPAYITYANKVLAPQLDPSILQEIRALEAAEDYANPRYTELIHTHYYPKHVLRLPLDEWPEDVNKSMSNINQDLYVTMQGPSEFGVVGDAKLKDWDITSKLSKITVPTLTIGGEYDTMDPTHMAWIATEVQNGQYLHCPNGSHFAMHDDAENYFRGVLDFIKRVDRGNKKE
ncbi:proline iminopeptidase-family hydrolase [Arenibacter lacus]|uniref:proline iminopeptidase-family hydrolase n=1 Tax=Arenibacter lacus TaxID=2608629 RepID=UPI00123CA9EC|nr:proline iminopeptidase-family hydrolase [Arenibacter lacus]